MAKEYKPDGVKQKEYDTDELKSILQGELADAVDYNDQLSIDRVDNTEYYLGESPPNVSDQQSGYISTDVRDSILYMLPSIMRVFFGAKKIVEFVPKNSEDVKMAEQQTDYINHVVQQKNNGFQVFYNAFKDALVRKAGFVKAYYDDSLEITNYSYDGLSEEARNVLLTDPFVEVVSETYEMETVQTQDPTTGEVVEVEKPSQYNLKIRRVKNKNDIVIEAVPPEEILLSRNARSLEDASYVAHRRIMTTSELVAMGYDKEEIEEYGGATDYDATSQMEAQARNPFADITDVTRTDQDEIYYVEHYLFYDLDEDGIDERIKVCSIGECHIINVEPVNDLPIVMFCPDPEPHTAIGSCPTDYVKQVQNTKSQIMRDVLDSLGNSVHPRLAITEGMVNIDDVLNTDIGQPIRQRAPGSVQPINIAFMGKEAFPVLQYLDEAKENATGVSKASAGLNAQALQSATQTAVQNTISSAQGRTELICRHFAESGMKPLFKIINNLVVMHSQEPETFRLNNEFITIDPRFWDSDKDISVNVAISKSSDEEKLKTLTLVLAQQEKALMQMGANNPLVTGQQYANTLTKIIEMAGFKDANQFINTTVQTPPPNPEDDKPSGEELLAMAETKKAEATAQKSVIDAENNRLKILLDDDFKRDQAQADAVLKVMEINAKYGTALDTKIIDALLERDKEVIRQEQKLRANGLTTSDPTIPEM
jgi:hypothetical protein